MVKNLMLTLFPKVLDIIFIIVLAFVVLGALGAGVTVGFVAFLSTLIGGILSLVIGFGMIYIQLDIRDTLKKIDNKNNE